MSEENFDTEEDGNSETDGDDEPLEEEDEDDEDDEDDDATTSVLDELVDVFRSENGRDPTEEEMLRWIKTLRDGKAGGPVSFEAMESDDDDEESEEDDDSESDEPPMPVKKDKKRVPERKEKEAPPAKKARDTKDVSKDSKTKDSETAPEPFVAAKKFAGAKHGYYFKKGAKGLGYYLDTNAPKKKGVKGVARAQAPVDKKNSVFSIPREEKQAPKTQLVDFLASKKFAGAKPGFVFKKGQKGLGYYLDRPPVVTWKGGGGGGGGGRGQRGDWAQGSLGGGRGGGGRRSGGKNKGGGGSGGGGGDGGRGRGGRGRGGDGGRGRGRGRGRGTERGYKGISLLF